MFKSTSLKKIAIVMENLKYGGATTHLLTLINNKKFKHTQFTIITNKTNNAVKSILKSCNKKQVKIIYYHTLNVTLAKSNFLKLFFFIIKPLLFLISIRQMYKILDKVNYDLLLANCGGYGDFRSEMASIFASRLLKKRNIHLLIHHCFSKPKIWFFLINFINLFIGKIINGLIFVSFATKNSIKKNTLLFTFFNNKYSVIHNGIVLRKIKKKKLDYFRTRNGTIKVGMLSRIEAYKGQIDLIEGFNKLPESLKVKYKIFFVGSGDAKEVNYLKKKIYDYKLERFIKITKYINKESILILQNFNLFFSLTRDFEGFGYSIAEALYAGVPVVSTKVGGVTEFLNNKNSMLIKPMDTKSITKIFKDFAYNKKKWKAKIISGKSLIKNNFNSNIMSSNYLNYFIKNEKIQN